MNIYENTKANAKRIGWELISPEHFTGDPTASHVAHDHVKGHFYFIEIDNVVALSIVDDMSEECYDMDWDRLVELCYNRYEDTFRDLQHERAKDAASQIHFLKTHY